MKSRDWIAFLSLTLIWGASFLWIKVAVQDIDPVSLVAFRLALGLAGLIVFFPLRKPPIPRSGRTWVYLAALGALSSAVPWVLIAWAETKLESAIASVLNSSVPLWTILISYFSLHDEPITPERILGLLLGFGGVVVLAQRPEGPGVLRGAGHVHLSLAGLGAMILAAISYASGAVHARRNLRGVSPLIQAFFSMAFSLALILPAMAASGRTLAIPTQAGTWAAVAWLGVLGAGIASLMFYGLLHSIGPVRTSLITYALPVIGVTLGVLVLKERLDWHLVVGLLLIVSGVWVVHRR